ncbi:hypothetical protein A8F94_08930 [Bacillus sp. FJAT-27225]|uniref:hypothetical protein n=1 Tax=Bacillus sp. FJAT-27225 TaxID=1743144 RepID=UPI00080C2D0B|nr:hypothetical protein [Bacillus sp. FJAT-27225]OCA87941.1 hypothetical protein A8F94_08930 [Bacillus sp. FJAT-27225]
MKQIISAFFLSLLLIMSGCNNSSVPPKISKEEAKSVVLLQHGKVKIISVSHQDNEYIVKWEDKANCSSGTDYVDDDNGEITKAEMKMC